MLQIWQRLYKLSPILFAPDLTGPFCQRGSCMEKQMSCQNPISKLWIPSDLMKLFASTLGVPVELFTVPVLSEPREYEAAEYWRYELGAELD